MTMTDPGRTFIVDALLPGDIALRAEAEGVKKATTSLISKLTLAFLGGSFIGLGALFSTLALTGTEGVVPFGLARIFLGLAFCLGPILVIAGGAELFTSNNLIVMAWANRKISTFALLRSWALVYVGNFVGATALAGILFMAGHHSFGGDQLGRTALQIANHKVNLNFFQALILGVLCNTLVCLAMWLAMGARSTTDKILATIFPITLFMAAGFEQSIANMYFISFGVLINTFDAEFVSRVGLEVTHLDLGGFVSNLIPVTIGNIIGGGGMVSLVYWFVYLYPSRKLEHHS
jgi:formate transporter